MARKSPAEVHAFLQSVARGLRVNRPATRQAIADWLAAFLGMSMPETPVCPQHQTPLDYLTHSFLEEAQSHGDAVVWACRGGGKTMIGAVATLLDLLFKPGVQVRILGGSLEQSEKMYAYLRTLVQKYFESHLAASPTQRRLQFKNGSRVEVLAQSDHSVRGQRVQKLRCDEVELFDPRVWQAAQLTTRSLSPAIRGTVEGFSTMHRPGGLMQQILTAAPSSRRKTFAWCVWDIIENCPASRSCDACPLWTSCRGRAKQACGFMNIDDVIAMQSRVSVATWQHEMLCLPPRLEDAVFSAFNRELHERAMNNAALVPGQTILLDDRRLRFESIVCGVDFGYAHAFVCLWMAMFREQGRRLVWVLHEMVTAQKTVQRNADDMKRVHWTPALVYCDVAGNHPNSQTGKTDDRVLRDAGFRTRSRPMSIDEGIDMINDLLDPASGPPRLFIDPACSRLLAAMEGYRRACDGRPIKDGQHDHLIDALRYALVNHDSPAAKTETRPY